MAWDANPQQLRAIRAVVVGDAMLDVYVQGEVDRISPEAPVPVIRRGATWHAPGGAANVAMNFAALGGSAFVTGLAGQDHFGQTLRDALSQRHDVRHFLVAEKDRPTTVKTRYIAGSQQILRVDVEDTRQAALECEQALLDGIAAELETANIVVLADYDKGVLSSRMISAIISMANARGLPTIVDPKKRDFAIYRGASFIKPNLSELERASGISCRNFDDQSRAAKQLMAESGANLLVTNAGFGMTLYLRDEQPLRVDAFRQEVYDVSGAGDTAIAAFALAYASGADPGEAMKFANAAAGVAVSKLGTAAVSFDEVDRRVLPSPNARRRGVLSRKDACEQRNVWRGQGLKVGFTNGCFDILHAGHISLLQAAAAECDRLIVGLNSDASVKRLKGTARPLQDENSRSQVLSAMRNVDAIVLFSDDTPRKLIEELSPDVLVKGADYQTDEIVGADWVKAHGGRVVRADLLARYSTTNILSRKIADD